MSKLVGEVVNKVWSNANPPCVENSNGELVGTCFPPQVIAQALALTAGMVICTLGLLRLGWLVDFIPLVAVSAFITGSALSIAVGQIPNLLGKKRCCIRLAFDNAYSIHMLIFVLVCL